jgi:hypothetical protein
MSGGRPSSKRRALLSSNFVLIKLGLSVAQNTADFSLNGRKKVNLEIFCKYSGHTAVLKSTLIPEGDF